MKRLPQLLLLVLVLGAVGCGHERYQVAISNRGSEEVLIVLDYEGGRYGDGALPGYRVAPGEVGLITEDGRPSGDALAYVVRDCELVGEFEFRSLHLLLITIEHDGAATFRSGTLGDFEEHAYRSLVEQRQNCV